ncbi:hypothetical protein [Cellvibrio sp. UBA7661]|uniref:hypothetical protein n=1 Tax=Cellvibrio sp. UBA7661 TaxID=1946311 RepID=UPI002F35590C
MAKLTKNYRIVEFFGVAVLHLSDMTSRMFFTLYEDIYLFLRIRPEVNGCRVAKQGYKLEKLVKVVKEVSKRK